MKNPHFVSLPYKIERPAPPFGDQGIACPESLIRYVLKTYTKKGEKIFDPFAGLGTTLFVAEEIGRVPYGIEAERQRFEWTAGQLTHWQNIHHADAGRAGKLGLPKMDACVTCPPFMAKDHSWNPLYSGDKAHAGYDAYLKRMKVIFAGIAPILKKGAPVIVQVDNIRGSRAFTPLVRDIAGAIAPTLPQIDEKIIRWERGPADYPYTQILVFKKA